MNLSAALEFGPNGRLFKNYEEFKALLMLNVCVAIISSFVILSFVYYMFQFKRREGAHKYYNQKLVILTFSLMGISVLFWALNFLFYYQASSIFSSPNVAKNVIITFIAFGFASIFSAMCLLWFRVAYYGVVIDDERFWFFGENLTFSKVSKIINDEKAQRLYINYASSPRTFKRYRLKSDSGVAQFLIANLPPTLAYENGDQSAYFKELTKTPSAPEK